MSLTNITGIIGPLLFAFIYSYSVAYWDGLLWLMGAILYAMLLITAYFHQEKPHLKLLFQPLNTRNYKDHKSPVRS